MSGPTSKPNRDSLVASVRFINEAYEALQHYGVRSESTRKAMIALSLASGHLYDLPEIQELRSLIGCSIIGGK